MRDEASSGMLYGARTPIAPGRAYALRMPGGPTGGPYDGKSRTICPLRRTC